ncbi:hypothetical protein A6E05_10135 [Aliivibrio sp. 1S165]|uniref:hypothetical protein n=1 Tax=unclassified Aliivibrio TaxID=2645654 RepID=UPI00080E21B5|nr:MULTISPECIES: hypothetical protein [unclassified Aliivibrio]OCH11923.1 hypothetical protein A6E05_10135 [Aliivibrio sp. 1S165]OCH35849.1 hypothetical protein A6E06_10865 [Aliivibrio sp. 1S175]
MTKENNKDITIVINSCDSYSDVWPLFLSAFGEYWSGCEYPIIINTEFIKDNLKVIDKNIDIHNVNNIDDAWGSRLLQTLNSISSEYVLLLFDDYILESEVDDEAIKKIISFLDDNKDAAVYYLNSVCNQTHKDEPNLPYRVLKNYVDYRLNSAPAIWRRRDLIALTGEGDNPWAWEVFGSYRTYTYKKTFYSVPSISRNLFPYDYRKGGAIYRGKWVEDVVVPKIEKYQLNIDITTRGATSKIVPEKRTLMWKINFLLLGYKMVGFKSLFFVFNAIRSKVYGR